MTSRAAEASSKLEAESILSVDVGTSFTRVALFDVVENRYRLLGVARALTTAEFPVLDVSEGIHQAVEALARIVGRTLSDSRGQLILPTRPDGSGVGVVALSFSLQAEVRAALVGLLAEYSLKSVRNLARSAPIEVVAEVSLGDREGEEALLDLLIEAHPDLIVIAGGTEGGASQALLRTLEVVGLSVFLLPGEQRPQVLFVGNSAVADQVRELLKPVGAVYVGPNVRPRLEAETLDGARSELNNRVVEILRSKLGGLDEPLAWTGGAFTPGAVGIGTVIRFLGQAFEGKKGVMGVSVGAGSTIICSAFGSSLSLSVRPDLNLGRSASRLLENSTLEEIAHWLPMEASRDTIRDYLFNKTIYPRSIPSTLEDLWLEQAIARSLIRAALRGAAATWQIGRMHLWPGLLPPCEPIVASGGALTNVPRPGQAALMLLDALEPPGITSLILDAHNLLPALGATARINPVAVVQVLDSPSFPNLGTVISPVGHTRPGDTVLRYQMAYEDGRTIRGQIPFGTIEVLPLGPGQAARIALQPSRHFDLGLGGPGQGGTIRAAGGLVGVIVDARGRPIATFSDPGRQRKAVEEWLMQIGG
ncbi:MAG: glutamate mutase L [Anaerolineales bacterium]|jgi:hypothetical protein